MADRQPVALSDEAGMRMWNQVVEEFVNPEIVRRIEAGEREAGEQVIRFQVLMPWEEDRPTRVLLDREVQGTAEVKMLRAVEAGEEITVADVGPISKFTLPEELTGTPHMTGLLGAEGWGFTFDFSYQHASARQFYDAGIEFEETASEALEASRVRAFVDNAFSAAELLARAELLCSIATVETVLGKPGHDGIASNYKVWADLGNTEKRFHRLLRTLRKRRGESRYLDRDVRVDHEAARGLAADLRDMATHVRRELDGEGGRHNVIAARELRAGELVTRDSYKLRPDPPTKPDA